MNWLSKLTEALATRGGSIVLLVLGTTCAGVAELICLHYKITGEGEAMFRTAFAGFNGALLFALTTSGKTPPSNPTDRPTS